MGATIFHLLIVYSVAVTVPAPNPYPHSMIMTAQGTPIYFANGFGSSYMPYIAPVFEPAREVKSISASFGSQENCENAIPYRASLIGDGTIISVNCTPETEQDQ